MAGETILLQLDQLMVPERNYRPDGYGSIPNYEGLIYSAGRAASGVITPVAVTTIFVDTPTIFAVGRPKSIVIVTSGTITWVGAGQVTAQLYFKRTPGTAATGPASAFPLADGNLVGTPANVGGAAVTTLANTAFLVTPTEIPQLQWDTGHIGVEIKFPAAPSQGSLYVVCWMSPN